MSLTVDSKGKQEWMNENKYVKVSGLLLGVEGDGKGRWFTVLGWLWKDMKATQLKVVFLREGDAKHVWCTNSIAGVRLGVTMYHALAWCGCGMGAPRKGPPLSPL